MAAQPSAGIRHRRQHPQPGRLGHHPRMGARRIPRQVWRHAPVPATSRPGTPGFRTASHWPSDRISLIFGSNPTGFWVGSLDFPLRDCHRGVLSPILRRQAKATRHGMTKRRIRREDITARHHIRIIRLIERLCLPHAKPAAHIIPATPQTPATYWQGPSCACPRGAHRTDKTVSKR